MALAVTGRVMRKIRKERLVRRFFAIPRPLLPIGTAVQMPTYPASLRFVVMVGSPETPGSRRKRVFRACDPCRALKSKVRIKSCSFSVDCLLALPGIPTRLLVCSSARLTHIVALQCDGVRPACGRCTGYGYGCIYSVSEKRRPKPEHRPEQRPHDVAANSRLADSLRRVVDDYDRLAADALPGLPLPDRVVVSERLTALRQRFSGIFGEDEAAVAATPSSSQQQQQQQPMLPSPASNVALPRPPAVAERYLGEVSDVRFFNLIDRALQEKKNEAGSSCSPEKPGSETALDSYEQDEPSCAAAAAAAVELEQLAAALPARDAAERYLDVYFSTIHMAYPFISRTLFVTTYRRYRANPAAAVDLDGSWLATLCRLTRSLSLSARSPTFSLL